MPGFTQRGRLVLNQCIYVINLVLWRSDCLGENLPYVCSWNLAARTWVHPMNRGWSQSLGLHWEHSTNSGAMYLQKREKTTSLCPSAVHTLCKCTILLVMSKLYRNLLCIAKCTLDRQLVSTSLPGSKCCEIGPICCQCCATVQTPTNDFNSGVI